MTPQQVEINEAKRAYKARYRLAVATYEAALMSGIGYAKAAIELEDASTHVPVSMHVLHRSARARVLRAKQQATAERVSGTRSRETQSQGALK